MTVVGGTLFLLPLALLYRLRLGPAGDRLRAVAEALTLWCLGILVVTEATSRFHLFRVEPMIGCYLAAIVGLTVAVFVRPRPHPPRLRLPEPVLVVLAGLACLAT